MRWHSSTARAMQYELGPLFCFTSLRCIVYSAILKLFGSFKGDAFCKRVLPFFMHVMCDVLAKRHFGNGMVEYGRFGTLRLLSLV